MNTMEHVKIRWEKGTRYYEAFLHKDLFGWVVTRTWGRKGSSMGSRLSWPCHNYKDALTALNKVKKQRSYKSYEVVYSRVG